MAISFKVAKGGPTQITQVTVDRADVPKFQSLAGEGEAVAQRFANGVVEAMRVRAAGQYKVTSGGGNLLPDGTIVMDISARVSRGPGSEAGFDPKTWVTFEYRVPGDSPQLVAEYAELFHEQALKLLPLGSAATSLDATPAAQAAVAETVKSAAQRDAGVFDVSDAPPKPKR
jgi:hypothetical protein